MLKLCKREKIIKNKYKLFFLFLFSLMTPIAQGQVLIFVSSSMPPASLGQWVQQAQRIGAPVILRGFVKGSLPETRAWLKPLLEQQREQGGIEINPIAFTSYGVTQVPAVVVTTGTLQCFSNVHCQIPAFDVIYGNITLAHALKTISEKGESSNILAKEKLMQLQGESK